MSSDGRGGAGGRGGRRRRPNGTGVRRWRRLNLRLPPEVDAPVAAAAKALGLGESEAVERSLRAVGVPYLTDLAAHAGRPACAASAAPAPAPEAEAGGPGTGRERG